MYTARSALAMPHSNKAGGRRRTVREGIELGRFRFISFDSTETGEGVHSIDVLFYSSVFISSAADGTDHGAGPADAFSTGPSEGQRRVNFVFDLSA